MSSSAAKPPPKRSPPRRRWKATGWSRRPEVALAHVTQNPVAARVVLKVGGYMPRLSVFLVLVSILAGACAGPAAAAQGPEKRWYKGNLHTHSLWSDGDDFPEMIADWYRARGYDFLALSDHNVL